MLFTMYPYSGHLSQVPLQQPSLIIRLSLQKRTSREPTRPKTIWVAARELSKNQHNGDIQKIIRFLNYGNLVLVP